MLRNTCAYIFLEIEASRKAQDVHERVRRFTNVMLGNKGKTENLSEVMCHGFGFGVEEKRGMAWHTWNWHHTTNTNPTGN